MLKKLYLAIFVAMAGVPSINSYAENISTEELTLFKQYKYGQSINDFSVEKGYIDCTNDIGKIARCTENIDFLGYKFSLALIFSNNTVFSVMLLSSYNEEIYRVLMASLPKNGFNLASMQGKSDRFDVVEVIYKEGMEAFVSKSTSFESAQLANGHISYVFFEIPLSDIRGYKNVAEAVYKTPVKARELDLSLTQGEKDVYITLTFTLPKMYLIEGQSKGRVSAEKF